MMGGAERFGLGPGFKRGAVLPHRVGRIKRVILGFGALSVRLKLVESLESFVFQRRWSDSLGAPSMWTQKNRPRYDRDHLRYPSDLTDEEWAVVAGAPL
jgi:hypothetical protein